MYQPAIRKRFLARDRRVPVICPNCGRQVERESRHQIYCSPACRKQAIRYLPPHAENKSLYGPPIQNHGTKPPKNIKQVNHFQNGVLGPRSVIEPEVFAGRTWIPAVSRDGVESLVAQLKPPALRRAQ
jgi:hypothetical protein